jgi:transposase
MNIITLGIDLAKNVFQLHGINAQGKCVLEKRLLRDELIAFIINMPVCTIIMEACSSSQYWARQFKKLGHEVKLISPQYVTPFVKRHKNDKNDAAAIVEAGTRPSMNFVPAKSIEQQDIQGLHRIRSRLVAERTALVNQVRGLLAEYGIVVAQGIHRLRRELPCILEDAQNELSDVGREFFLDLQEQLKAVDKKVAEYEAKIERLFKESDLCQRIATIPGIGVLTATAVIASIGDAKVFKNGRHLAAFLGLVPNQHSSGNKQRLLSISKRGDVYLRTLLIHGARSALRVAHKKTDKRSCWVVNLKERAGENKTCVALANKNARTLWALLARHECYKPIAV